MTASAQSAGRGRQGRSWHDQPGASLLYSAILRPLGPQHGLLPLAVPLAVCEAAESLVPVECRVKWPNDVWAGDRRKLAGILIEARPGDGWAVIGVGLNVDLDEALLPAELRESTASLGAGVTVDAAREALNTALTRWTAVDPADVRDAFAERDALRGQEVSWADGRGTAAGISQEGNLLVDPENGGQVELRAGEVHLGRG